MSSPPQIGRFYAGVAALVRRPSDGRYLLLRRSDQKDFGQGAWECVTGRVDQGEGFPEAALREVKEELGATVQIEFLFGTLHFYRGEAIPENEMVGAQFCCLLDESMPIQLSAEHSEARWVTAEEADQLLPAGHWLRQSIRQAEAMLPLVSGPAGAALRASHPEWNR